MQVELTRRALARMKERCITRDEVLNTLAHPLRTIQAENDRLEAQGRKYGGIP